MLMSKMMIAGKNIFVKLSKIYCTTFVFIRNSQFYKAELIFLKLKPCNKKTPQKYHVDLFLRLEE